jgi:hypothetical protein
VSRNARSSTSRSSGANTAVWPSTYSKHVCSVRLSQSKGNTVSICE